MRVIKDGFFLIENKECLYPQNFADSGSYINQIFEGLSAKADSVGNIREDFAHLSAVIICSFIRFDGLCGGFLKEMSPDCPSARI